MWRLEQVELYYKSIWRVDERRDAVQARKMEYPEQLKNFLPAKIDIKIWIKAIAMFRSFWENTPDDQWECDVDLDITETNKEQVKRRHLSDRKILRCPKEKMARLFEDGDFDPKILEECGFPYVDKIQSANVNPTNITTYVNKRWRSFEFRCGGDVKLGGAIKCTRK